MIHPCLSLCLVTHPDSAHFENYLQFILNAVKGGVSSVQLRIKTNEAFTERCSRAFTLKSLLSPLKIPLIINDDVELALAINADGVHLGQLDGCPLKARKQLGSDKLIGLTIESFTELEHANTLAVINYVAASSIFQSPTKLDCKTIWGLQKLQEVVKRSRHPVIAIGGINITNVSHVLEQGVAGIAVVSAIHNSLHPEKIAREIRSEIRRVRHV